MRFSFFIIFFTSVLRAETTVPNWGLKLFEDYGPNWIEKQSVLGEKSHSNDKESQITSKWLPMCFFFDPGVDAAKAPMAISVILKELARIRDEKVAPGELRRAKDYFMSQLYMALEDTLDHLLWVGERVLVVATGAPGGGCTVTMPDAIGANVAGSVVSLYVNGGDNLVIARSSTNTFNNGTTSITLSNDYEGCTLVAVNTASHVGWLLIGVHSPIRTTPY